MLQEYTRPIRVEYEKNILVGLYMIAFDLQAVSSIIVDKDPCLALFTRKTGGHALFCVGEYLT